MNANEVTALLSVIRYWWIYDTQCKLGMGGGVGNFNVNCYIMDKRISEAAYPELHVPKTLPTY